MSAVASLFQNLNPVLDRELRQRSRSAKSVIVMSMLLAALTGVLYVVYLASTSSNEFRDPLDTLSTGIGATMFEIVLFAELGLLLLIIPGVSASAISGERDRQTLIPLQITLMGRGSILFGKVAASSAFVLLLLIASAPLLAVPYLLGGVSLFRILMGFLATLATGILYATLGVACSAYFRRTQTATLMTYVIIVILTIGSIITVVVIGIFQNLDGNFSDPSLVPLYWNPFVGVADAAGEFDRAFDNQGPFSGIKESVFGDGFAGDAPSTRPDWLISLGAQAALVGIWVLLALRKLRLPQVEID
ncbi:MAG: ABC transporter permease [Acidimicrobiia bacterium]|nr:ABC transporter permease [Acidimicrobiia bacterium]